ncbi:hypothetical protein [Paraburkholderia fungorum]|uniref:hypothetical protein n=1 Tax=Paraburkholderia fungorum TaxID=134537 RepID=UPI00209240F9|nr:hypothetical protein [Paraburkholderia fungorum]USU21336.1 hypothetical protein NFE55_30060 [Paraburkholderia fungorum]USU26668.1 hypothetical protein NFS19_31505 [Paraburkholderia fungorum]
MATRRVRGEIRESSGARDAKERTRIHERERDNLYKLRISNAENLDKSVLTYSGAGLGLSLGFLKDFIPIEKAKFAWALYGSWVALSAAMVLVIASYVVSQIVIDAQIERAERYYEDGEEDVRNECTKTEKVAQHLNGWIYATAFGIGLVLTILFVSFNLSGADMANKHDKSGNWAVAEDGAIGTKMQRVEKGVTGGKLQPVNPAAPKQPTPQPQSGNTPQNKK